MNLFKSFVAPFSEEMYNLVILAHLLIKSHSGPGLGSSVGWSIFLMHQGCRFNPWVGHIQESTNGCMNR